MLVNEPVSFDGTNGLMNGSRGIREDCVTAGLTYKINQGVVLKTDIDFAKTGIAT